jgi:hypothetical protein
MLAVASDRNTIHLSDTQMEGQLLFESEMAVSFWGACLEVRVNSSQELSKNIASSYRTWKIYETV